MAVSKTPNGRIKHTAYLSLVPVVYIIIPVRAGGSNFIMPRPVAGEGHDFWGDLVKNYVEFNYPM